MKRNAFGVAVCLFCAGILTALGTLPAFAENTEYHWYCRHVPDHTQPRAGAELLFAEELGGYYIDHRHTEPTDPDKVVYLTFDAGYENGNVEKILNVLGEESVPGAFFILGNLIRTNPALVQRMAEEGHTVCNHTVRHKNMSHATEEELMRELHELETLYEEKIGGTLAKYYRPPEGTFSRSNLECCQKNGYRTIFWSFAYPDWDNAKQMSPEQAKKIILDNVHNGEVLLLHPTSATNAAILADVIRELKQEGYRFGTLEELTGEEGSGICRDE